MDRDFESSLMADNPSLAHPYNRRQVVTIDVLPDDVLLAIFDFYVVGYRDLGFIEALFSGHDTKTEVESWQSLVHVCRRWRGLVLGSPRGLNLQLWCTPGTSARKSLDVWPALPLLIQGGVSETSVDNVIAELEHSDRICKINLNLNCDTTPQIEKLWTAMQVPFPELANLYLAPSRGLSYLPVLPDSFLGGSVPRLQYLWLDTIPFPGLPRLLLSATHLVRLRLVNIPHSGYISPEAMVTCLSVLTSLEELDFKFNSPQSSPDQESRRPLPSTRSVLPALTRFSFKGVNEYLEELVARIDTPRLYQLSTEFFNDIDFDTPELIRFISRKLTLEAPIEARVVFGRSTAWVTLQSQTSYLKEVKVEILCSVPDWQLSSLAQICTSSLPLLSTTESLYIHEPLKSQLDWKDGAENTEWLELLLPFTAVKDLYLSKQFAPRIAPALQEFTEGRTTEVLPTLQNLFLEGFQPSEPTHKGIAHFISARQLTNRPVAISVWERDSTVASASTSRSSFASVFNAALDSYKRKTKKDLASHPLLPSLQSCDSPEAVLTVLRERIPAFNQSQNGDDRLTKWVSPTVNVLYASSATVGQGVGLAFPPANVIFAGIGVLLLTAKDAPSTDQGKIIDIFNHMEHSFRRLEIYTFLTPTAAMTDVIVEIMVEVLSILAIATREVKRGPLKKYLRKLAGNRDIEDSLERLDKLTQEEARMASAELLKMTHSVDSKVMGVGGRDKGVEGKVQDVRGDVQDVDTDFGG